MKKLPESEASAKLRKILSGSLIGFKLFFDFLFPFLALLLALAYK